MVKLRILFIADSESQLRPAATLASRIAADLNWEVLGNILPAKNRVSRRQLIGANLDCPLTFEPLAEMMNRSLLDFAAIVAFLPGSKLHQLACTVEDLVRRHGSSRRPILVAGYNGVVYEKRLEGLLWRIGYDIICVNSEYDLDEYTKLLKRIDRDPTPLTRTGLLLAQRQAPSKPRKKVRDIKKVLFACQAIVPLQLEERVYLLEKLREYALSHPDRTVYVKPRALPGETTFHTEKHHYEQLYRDKYGGAGPKNLLFCYGSLGTYLSKIDLLVTVSSTAIFEALALGISGAILTDVGIKESFGNHFFLDSGMLTTMDAIIADNIPSVRSEWLSQQGLGDGDYLGNASKRVLALWQAQGSKALEFNGVFYDRTKAPFIYGALIPEEEQQSRQPRRLNGTEVTRKLRKLRKDPVRFFVDAWGNQSRKLRQIRSR